MVRPAQLFAAVEGAEAHGHTGAERLAMARISDRLDTTPGHTERSSAEQEDLT